MRLILIRHGHAPHHAIDHTRKLSEQGRKEAATAGQWLSTQNHNAKKILHSPLSRAVETAKIIHAQLSRELTFGEDDSITPESPISPWIHQSMALTEDLILVGHMPFLANFATELVGKMISFPTGGVVILEKREKREKQEKNDSNATNTSFNPWSLYSSNILTLK